MSGETFPATVHRSWAVDLDPATLYALLRLPFAAYAWAFHAPLIVPRPLRVGSIGARFARVLA